MYSHDEMPGVEWFNYVGKRETSRYLEGRNVKKSLGRL